MKKILESERIPIKLWLDNIENGALQQAKNLANFPFSFKHIALMPDTHQGFGMPIGGVMATKNVIIPNAVGVDIGCGMCAVRTSLTEISKDNLLKIVKEIKQKIPVSFKKHKQQKNVKLMPHRKQKMKIVDEQFENARYQLGTLGGGNHFIEIQKASDKHIWIMIHSGSRNLGKKVADYYNFLAKQINKTSEPKVPEKMQLAYLHFQRQEAFDYLNEMQYCVQFALLNRKIMLEEIKKIVSKITKAQYYDFINVAHNYANKETHFGEEVFVHRKGATSARKNELGIIPGSQGTKSYIIRGVGNPESFMSCSHGAGRLMGRQQAKRTLNLKDEINFMNKKGIIHNISSVKHLDEAPHAYKDINTVMNNQQDLVDIVTALSPLAVIKG